MSREGTAYPVGCETGVGVREHRGGKDAFSGELEGHVEAST